MGHLDHDRGGGPALRHGAGDAAGPLCEGGGADIPQLQSAARGARRRPCWPRSCAVRVLPRARPGGSLPSGRT
eukprot:3772476-Pyramimonas_sp.AAC.2